MELENLQSVDGYDALVDPNAKDKDTLVLFKYIAEEDKFEKLLENQQLIKTPVVRNGKQATVMNWSERTLWAAILRKVVK